MDVKPIQRFNIGDEGDLMQVANDGCYVDYDDHTTTVAALQARIAELEKDFDRAIRELWGDPIDAMKD